MECGVSLGKTFTKAHYFRERVHFETPGGEHPVPDGACCCSCSDFQARIPAARRTESGNERVSQAYFWWSGVFRLAGYDPPSWVFSRR